MKKSEGKEQKAIRESEGGFTEEIHMREATGGNLKALKGLNFIARDEVPGTSDHTIPTLKGSYSQRSGCDPFRVGPVGVVPRWRCHRLLTVALLGQWPHIGFRRQSRFLTFALCLLPFAFLLTGCHEKTATAESAAVSVKVKTVEMNQAS